MAQSTVHQRGRGRSCHCRLTVDLSGGSPHAKLASDEGFCVYADIAVAIAALRAEGRLGDHDRVACIDLEAHQANGVRHAFCDDSRAFIFDMDSRHLCPLFDLEAKARIDCALPVDSGCPGEEYFPLLQDHLPGFVDPIGREQPVALAICNAGRDVLAGDPLGQMELTANQMLERDLNVMDELRKREIQATRVLRGGYTGKSDELVADSVAGMFANF